MSLLLVDSAALEQSVIPDGLRLVRFVAPHYEAARPVPLLDLTTGERKLSEGGGVSLAPAERDRGNIRLDVPWAGEVTTLDRHGNARLSFTLRLLAGDPVADADWVVGQIVDAPGRSAIEWRRGGRPTYYPLRGDADWTPTYRMRERQQGAGMLVAFNIEVAPYAHRGSMDVVDEFAVDSLGDYTFDAGAGTAQVLSGQMVPSDVSEKRLFHSARGFLYGDVQVTLKTTMGASAASGAGVILKRLGPDDYLRVAYDGAGVAIHAVNGGVATLLASVAHARAANTAYWIRGRVEETVVIAEVFTATPTPMAAPAATASHTLAGVDAAKFGAGVAGGVGLRLVPAGTDERYDDFVAEPYTYRNRNHPQILLMRGAVPGDLPALASLHVTTSGTEPAFGLASWWRRPNGAHIRGGSGTAWTIDPTGAPGVDEDGDYELDVWATISTAGTRVISVSSPLGATRYGSYGTAGVAVPNTGSRLVYLGQISIAARGASTLNVNTAVDNVLVLPARGLVRSPIGVVNDASYPKFVRSLSQSTRILHADGSGSVGPPNTPMREHGLGRRIEIGPGSVNLLLRLSSLVPHDPNVGATAETAQPIPATVRARVLPRFVLA